MYRGLAALLFAAVAAGCAPEGDGWEPPGAWAEAQPKAAATAPSPGAPAPALEAEAQLALPPRATTAPLRAIALGAFVSDFGGTAPGNASVLDAWAVLVGRKPAVVLWYQDWSTSNFPVAQLDAVVGRGLAPMLTWEPWRAGAGAAQPAFKLSAIAAGDHDGLISAFARGAKSWGKPFYLRFAHEMNGDWYPWGTKSGNPNGNLPADYVAAWRHVRAVFASEGATNARWVWCPNVLMPGAPSVAALYPGDAQVDWLGLDGYNFGALHGATGWKSLAAVFGASHDAIAALSPHPLAIVETASTELGGDKASWISQGLGVDLPARLPRVRAVVWFHTDKETDWRVSSSAGALAAFRAQVASPRYQGAMP